MHCKRTTLSWRMWRLQVLALDGTWGNHSIEDGSNARTPPCINTLPPDSFLLPRSEHFESLPFVLDAA